MRGYVDLHCHYLPAIDDGVRTFEEGVRLCTGLHALGYDVVVATPHIRTAMFENRRPGLLERFAEFSALTGDVPGMPTLGLGAEHFFDDIGFSLLKAGDAVPYPGDHAALVEFPEQVFPARVEQRFFELRVKGLRTVLAHPERYRPLHRRSDAIDPLLDGGVLPLLDLMSLVGRYGRAPRRAAERMLEEGVYFAACTDSHKPSDLELVEEAIERLTSLVGDEESFALLADHPRRILSGELDTDL